MPEQMPDDLRKFIDGKMADIAHRLPPLVLDAPDSFRCGIFIGYRNALIAIESLFEGDG